MKYNKFRKLGKNGEEVAPVGIGAMSFTNFSMALVMMIKLMKF